ncbi:MAG: PAS domain-containing protein [Micropepsaceae bacterium]
MNPTLTELARYLTSCNTREDFKPMAIPALLRHVYVLDIETDEGSGTPLFKIKLTGTSLDTIFGRALSGRHLHEFVHGPKAAEVMNTY